MSEGVIESGEWQGKYIDVNGFSGKIRFVAKADGAEFTGDYELEIIGQHEPFVIKGPISGVAKEGAVRMEITPIRKEKSPIDEGSIIQTGQLSGAGSYAKQALFGTVQRIPVQSLGGGIWIAWRFAERKKG